MLGVYADDSALAAALVVDDDESIRATLRDFLSDESYGALLAADGAEALALLRSSAQPRLRSERHLATNQRTARTLWVRGYIGASRGSTGKADGHFSSPVRSGPPGAQVMRGGMPTLGAMKEPIDQLGGYGPVLVRASQELVWEATMKTANEPRAKDSNTDGSDRRERARRGRDFHGLDSDLASGIGTAHRAAQPLDESREPHRLGQAFEVGVR